MRRIGRLLLGAVVLVAVAAPWIAPNPPERRFGDLLYAPPTPVHFWDEHARVPHVHGWRLVSRLERRFVEDATATGPVLLLGADAYGRDILARVLHGARTSLAVALLATLAAVLLGAIVGACAGYAGGHADEVISRTADFVLVLPVTYVLLALRAVMPLVLPASTIFLLLTAIFALAGWPIVARGVRAIVVSERERDYVVAGRALGAGPARLLLRHLLPAAGGYLLAQGALLLPAFIVAEATLSYVGLGFPDSVPTWGTMLMDASSAAVIADAPWMLAPAGAIFVVVLAVNLVMQGKAPVQLR